MTTGRAYIEDVNDSVVLGVIRTARGDCHELECCTWNHARHRIEDFCKVNEIAITEMPHRKHFVSGGSSMPEIPF